MKNILFLTGILFSTLAVACLHYPIDYQGTVNEHKQEFFIFKTPESFHLIAKTNLSTSGKLPPRLAWILPLPSVPVKYDEVDPKVFKELHELTYPVQKSIRGGAVFSDNEIKVHEAQAVGRYKVRPLEILSVNPKTASVLDQWLKENNLKAMPKEKQLQYLKKGAVFLIIDADLKGLEAADFKPLHIILKPIEEYTLPLNFTHSGRSFAVDVYALGIKLDNPAGGLVHSSSVRFSFAGGAYPELANLTKMTTGEMIKYEGKYDGKGASALDPVFK
jgi:hypothetical protein